MHHFRTYFSGDWDVHWGHGILTHGHVAVAVHQGRPLKADLGSRWALRALYVSHWELPDYRDAGACIWVVQGIL